jgi:hypothetical protein
VHDAVTAEKAGIVATAIITDRFVQTAQAMAQVSGMPGFPLAVIPHPISNNDDALLHAKALEAVRQCAAILVRHELGSEETNR